MLKFLPGYMIVIIIFSIPVSSTPLSLDSQTFLLSPPVIQITVTYRAQFQVPYPEFYFDGAEFIFSPQSDVFIENIDTQWSGTGFIITDDGYVLTNAHIADAEYYQKFGYLLEHARDIADFFIEEQTLSYMHYDFFIQKYYDYLVQYGNFTQELTMIQMTFGRRSFNMNIVTLGDPIGLRTSKDIALLKATIPEDYIFPTVKLGDSNEVIVGDRIIALGYPIDSNTESFDPQWPLSSYGSIVNVRSFEGWEAFQTNADITHGYSGGPAFNTDGAVIGLASFGAISPLTQTIINFLIPINIAYSFMEIANVNNTRSVIDAHYEGGMHYYWKNEYNLAWTEFTQVLSYNSDHVYAQHFLMLSQQKLNTNVTSTTDNLPQLSSIQTYTQIETKTSISVIITTITDTITVTDHASLTTEQILFSIAIISAIIVCSFIVLQFIVKKRT